MRKLAAWVGSSIVVAVFATMTLGLLYLLPFFGFVFQIPLFLPGACITETLGKISDVAGLEFEISDTNCDVIAKDEAITIFVSRRGERKKTALFKYDPGTTEIPVITAVDQHTLRISLPDVASTFFSKDRWEDWTITYDIGHIAFPGKSDPAMRR